MSQRHYLLSTTVLSVYDEELRKAAQEQRATVVEVAEANYVVPLPWLACFRPRDLRPCTVNWSSQSVSIMVPCVELPTAVENLLAALPLFERLTGEAKYAKEYWQSAVRQMLSLQLPFVTLDVSEMLMNVEPQTFNASMTSMLDQTEDALDVMRQFFFQYHLDVLPYEHKEFRQGLSLDDERRVANSVALDVGIRSPSPASFRGEKWRSLLQRRSLGLGAGARRA